MTPFNTSSIPSTSPTQDPQQSPSRHPLLPTYLTILLLLHSLSASSFPIIIRNGDTKIVNPCSVRTLSSFLPTVKYGRGLTITESNPEIQKICPSLKYSCCTQVMLGDLSAQLRKSFAYLEYRMTHLKKLFKMSKSIAKETYSLFLQKRTFSDINCFNKIQDEKLKRSKFKFRKNSSILKKIDENRKGNYFNQKGMNESFHALKSNLWRINEILENYIVNKKALYGGMVCSMCSPSFFKFLHVSHTEEPNVLEISKHQCSQILLEKKRMTSFQYMLSHMQKIIDISFCAKNNSLENLNYGSDDWFQNFVVNGDIVQVEDLNTKVQKCIEDPRLYRLVYLLYFVYLFLIIWISSNINIL